MYGGGHNGARAGKLIVLSNIINGFKVVKVLKISAQIIPHKDTHNILLYHPKINRNTLHSVSRMKK